MNKLRKTGKRILSALLCLLTLISPLSLTLSLAVGVFADSGASEAIRVSVAAEATAGTNNVVIFPVTLTGVCGEDVTVSYHTENRSAVAPDDYDTISSSVTIPAGSTSADIYVTVTHQQEFAVETRFFAVVLDGVSGPASIDTANDTCLCRLRTRMTLNLKAEDNISYLTEYKNLQYMEHDRVEDIDGGDSWYSWDNGMSLNNSTTQSWVNGFHNTGLANIFATMYVESFSWQNMYSARNFYVTFGSSDWFRHYGNPFLYLDCDPANGLVGPADKLDNISLNIIIGGGNPYDSSHDYFDVENKSQNGTWKKLYFNNPKTFWFGEKGKLNWNQFVIVKPDSSGVVDIGGVFENGALENDYYLEGLTFLMMLADTSAPTLEQYWLDDSSLGSTGMLRLILRFSEPVYAPDDSVVSVKLNGNSVSKLFYYEGGNYSDTLYYEWKAEKKDYESFGFQFDETSGDKIRDLAYNLDQYSNGKNNTAGSFGTSHDVRITPILNYADPVITFEPKTNGWAKYHEVDVSFGPSNSGTVYYTWDTSSDIYSDPARYTEHLDFSQNMVTLSADGLDGPYYLHVLVETKYHSRKAATTERAFYFDNTPPEYTLAVQKNTLPNKAISLNFHDIAQTVGRPGGAGISTLTMTITPAGGSANTYTLLDKYRGTQDPLLWVREVEDDFTCIYRSALFGLTADGERAESEEDTFYNADSKIIGLMNGEDRITVSVCFTLTDNSGNTVSTKPMTLIYDSRENFGPSYEVGYGLSPMEVPGDIEVYDIGAASSTTLTVRSGQSAGFLRLALWDFTGSTLDGITYQGGQIGGTVNAFGVPDEITLEGLKPGYYEISPYFVMESYGGEEEVMVSEIIRFYITSGQGEETANYAGAYYGDLVLTNRVYQLEDVRYHYLPGIGENPKTFNYGAVYSAADDKYLGGSPTPSFSSLNEMRDYVTYMEYQDMYLVSISDSAAKFLNNGTGSTIYVKADNETTVAKANQLWIRYKRSTWNPESSSYGWVFYYYGSGNVEDGIDVRLLSANLRSAVYAVRDTICREAVVRYLVEYDTTDPTTGAPKLNPAQMHNKPESVTETVMGTPLAAELTYAGDSKLFENFVNISDKVLPLATNQILHVSECTKLFYHYGEGYSPNWNEVDAADGMPVRIAMVNCTTGIYTIMEIDEYGMRQYEVYLDFTSPSLDADLNGDGKTFHDDTMTYSGTEFVFSELFGEADRYSYAAVYAFTSGKLLNVYFADELAGVALSDSNYYIQVGDRSGNTYTFTLRLANSTLDVSTELSSFGNGIVVTVRDRSASEIYRYEVYCNNILISQEYVERKLYTKPGVYSVFVQDIYGNIYRSQPTTYSRSIPGLTWYYQNSYGNYTAYDPEKPASLMIAEDQSVFGQYLVSTSSLLRFRLSEDLGKCSFSFTGLSEENYTIDNTGTTVTINTLSGWTLKVWYDDNPDDYVSYVCTVDDVPPNVNVTYIGTPYRLAEAAALAEGMTTIPDTLAFIRETGAVMTAENEEIFSGSYISVSASDNFGLRSISVSIDGVRVAAEADENGVCHFDRYGKYVVTATDIFNNINVFSFTNTDASSVSFQTDGKDEEKNAGSGSLSYGKDRAVMSVKRNGEAEILIKDAGVSYYYHYRFNEDMLFEGKYIVHQTDGGRSCVTEWGEEPILEVGAAGVQNGIWARIASGDHYTVYAQFVSHDGMRFRVDCEDGTQDIEMRAVLGQGCLPEYRRFSLSKEATDIPILSGGSAVTTNSEGYVTYIPQPYTFGAFSPDLIVRIEEAFSMTMNFSSYTTVYSSDDPEWKKFDRDRMGFYSVRVTNIYGNRVEYVLRYSESASIVITALYKDGAETRFSAEYDKLICSNNSITVAVYGLNISFRVDGTEASPILDKDCSKLMFYTEGRHRVEIIETNGTVSGFDLCIGTDKSFSFNEEWLTGYNEAALKRREGYTNQRLTVVPDSLRIVIVSVTKDGETVTVYDLLSEDGQKEVSALEKCVGTMGDGVYTVGFRNIWGDLVTKTVNYRETPTLILTRVTASGSEGEPYDMELAVSKGFYSSNSLTFATEAETYLFTVDGTPVTLDIPKTYEFHTASGNGLFRYAVTYQDEYGFVYEFTASLLRQELEISTKAMEIIEIDDTRFTSSDIDLSFHEDYKATYTLNGGEAQPYMPGQSLRRDGKYVFRVTDIAGNLTTLTLTRDSVVNYVFADAKTEREVIQGGVANNTTVVLRSDEAEITHVFRNGKLLEKYDDIRFNLSGEWEILMKDKVGNTAYFRFILINNNLKEFFYDAPYGYTVSEVWKSDADGNRFLTTQKGDRIELTEDGIYSVVMLSEWDNLAVNYTVTIDTTPPKVHLVGCEEGEETANEVTLQGLSIGDIVSVYRDDELIRQIEIENARDVPVFSDGGRYEIVIENTAGVSSTLSFTRKHIANTASSVLIVIGCFALAGGVFIGLLYRNRSKVDR